MKYYIKYIILLITILIFSFCNSSNRNQRNFIVNDNQVGLLYKKNIYGFYKATVLEPGKYKIKETSELIVFNKIDSLSIEEFDILDKNAKSLYCQAQIKYTLNIKQVENIPRFSERIHDIKSYKKQMLVPEITSEVRSVTGNYDAIDLINKDYKNKAEIKKKIDARLDEYIDLLSIKLDIYKKEKN